MKVFDKDKRNDVDRTSRVKRSSDQIEKFPLKGSRDTSKLGRILYVMRLDMG